MKTCFKQGSRRGGGGRNQGSSGMGMEAGQGDLCLLGGHLRVATKVVSALPVHSRQSVCCAAGRSNTEGQGGLASRQHQSIRGSWEEVCREQSSRSCGLPSWTVLIQFQRFFIWNGVSSSCRHWNWKWHSQPTHAGNPDTNRDSNLLTTAWREVAFQPPHW